MGKRYRKSMGGKNVFCTTIMKWKGGEIKKIEMIQLKINQVKRNLSCNKNNKIKQEFPQYSFESWNEVHDFLNEKLK